MKLKNISIVFLFLTGAAGHVDAQSLYNPSGRLASLFDDNSARKVGDMIQVMISESQSISDKNNTKIERTSSLDASASEFHLTNHTPQLLPAIGISGSKKLDAKADSKRDATFSTVITAMVVDVLPNGYMVIKGNRRIFIDQEEKTIEITGIVRPYDVSPANTISSNKIAEARITFIGEGPVVEASKKGWLSRFFDKFWNFVWPF